MKIRVLYSEMSMKSFFRAPLLHFIVLGFILFVFDVGLGGKSENDPGQIHLQKGDIERIKARWKRTFGRDPTIDEIRVSIDEYVREEILYRTAKDMGLDENDSIVRRRLVQKIEFLSEDMLIASVPSDAELLTWYDKNIESYKEPARFTFLQVYFSSEKRGKNVVADVKSFLSDMEDYVGLSQGVQAGVGDPSLLSGDYEALSVAEVAAEFGSDFSLSLSQLPIGQWSGPVQSEFGIHAVYIVDRSASYFPEFVELRERLETDFIRDQRKRANREFYQELRAGYEISFDEHVQGMLMP